MQKKRKKQCLFCNGIFSGKQSLKLNEDSIHRNIKFDCQDCGKQSKQKGGIQHIKSVHGQKKYPCTLCDYQATRQNSLTSHEKSVHQGFKYPCTICGHKTSHSSSLNIHIQSKYKGKKYQCNSCDKEYMNSSHLSHHNKSVQCFLSSVQTIVGV